MSTVTELWRCVSKPLLVDICLRSNQESRRLTFIPNIPEDQKQPAEASPLSSRLKFLWVVRRGIKGPNISPKASSSHGTKLQKRPLLDLYPQSFISSSFAISRNVSIYSFVL